MLRRHYCFQTVWPLLLPSNMQKKKSSITDDVPWCHDIMLVTFLIPCVTPIMLYSIQCRFCKPALAKFRMNTLCEHSSVQLDEA